MHSLHDYAGEERVVGAQARALRVAEADVAATGAQLDATIARTEATLMRLGVARPAEESCAPFRRPPAVLRSFAELVEAAPRDASIGDALDEREMEATLARLHAEGRLPKSETNLDTSDWMIATTAGVFAAIADLAIVGLPAVGKVNQSLVQSGVSALLEKLLPPETVRSLEKACKVSYDASTNCALDVPVEGLQPRSHRFHSLGHDPILGWVVGVRDVLAGTFTAVGRDGRLVVQQTRTTAPGREFFTEVLRAFQLVAGHMLSDVNTRMGLPAPLMPLLQFLQVGSFGPKRRTVADIARFMYLKGYDFRQFLAGGLAPSLVEVLIRGAWIGRRLSEGCSFQTTLPDASIPRLRRQLLVAHATAAAINAGKVSITRNPLALNWAQWLAFLRYCGPEIVQQARQPGLHAAAEDSMLDRELSALLGRV